MAFMMGIYAVERSGETERMRMRGSVSWESRLITSWSNQSRYGGYKNQTNSTEPW